MFKGAKIRLFNDTVEGGGEVFGGEGYGEQS
jgi:hypothetical protein